MGSAVSAMDEHALAFFRVLGRVKTHVWATRMAEYKFTDGDVNTIAHVTSEKLSISGEGVLWCGDHRTQLVRVQGTLTKIRYMKEILQNKIDQGYSSLYDNAPPHRSHTTQNFFSEADRSFVSLVLRSYQIRIWSSNCAIALTDMFEVFRTCQQL